MRGDALISVSVGFTCASHQGDGTALDCKPRKSSRNAPKDDKGPREVRLDALEGPVIYERYVQIATLRALLVLSFEELECCWSLMPLAPANPRGEAPASLRSLDSAQIGSLERGGRR